MSERGIRSSLRDGWPAPANVDRSPLTFVAGPGLPQGHQRVDGHERDCGDDERYYDSLFHATLTGVIRSRAADDLYPGIGNQRVTVQRAYSGSRGALGSLTGTGAEGRGPIFGSATYPRCPAVSLSEPAHHSCSREFAGSALRDKYLPSPDK